MKLQWSENRTTVIFYNNPWKASNLNKALLQYAMSQLKLHAGILSVQGAFLNILDNSTLTSTTFQLENKWWTVNLLHQSEVIYSTNKPTNFTSYIWNRENDSIWPFCNHRTESMVHLLNGCRNEFGNFHSNRHDSKLSISWVQVNDRRFRSYDNKNIESILPEHRERLLLTNCRKAVKLLESYTKIDQQQNVYWSGVPYLLLLVQVTFGQIELKSYWCSWESGLVG